MSKDISEKASQIGTGVFFVGLGLLFLSGWWWPGIMFVIAASILARTMAEGEGWQSARALLADRHWCHLRLTRPDRRYRRRIWAGLPADSDRHRSVHAIRWALPSQYQRQAQKRRRYPPGLAPPSRGHIDRQTVRAILMPAAGWWNGRHGCLKSTCPQGREGSSPSPATLGHV